MNKNKTKYFLFGLLIAIAFFGNFYSAKISLAATYTPLAPIPGYVEAQVGNDLNGYLNGMFKLGIALAVGLAVVMIIIGGVQYMSTDAIGKKSDGKARITAAIVGLLVALGSYMLLNTLDPNLLKTELVLNDVQGGQIPLSGDNGRTVYVNDRGGAQDTYYDSGRVSTQYPNGTKVTRDKDGNVRTDYPDGTHQTKNSNGDTVDESTPPPNDHEPEPPQDNNPPDPNNPPFEEPPLPEPEPTDPPNPNPQPCTPGQTPPAQNSPERSVYAIGDSIMEDGKADLQRELTARGLNSNIDGRQDRTMRDAFNMFYNADGSKNTATDAKFRSANTIIVELGTNQTTDFGLDLQMVYTNIREANPNAEVYFTEIFSTNPRHIQEYNNENEELNRLARDFPHAHVIPTKNAGIELGRSDNPEDDLVHPTSNGYKTLAKSLSGATPDCR